VSDRDRLERAIAELLDARADGATICPSDAARRVDPDGWRDLMDDARAAAARMVEAGRVEITQHGEAVDPATARGPIRIRRLP
jgi:ribosome modulation factor